MKKILTWIASMSLAFNLTATAIAKDLSYEERRAEQYKKFYQTYADKDYKIIYSGTKITYIGDEKKEESLTVLMYGNNLDDNQRYPYVHQAEYYYQESDGWHVQPVGQNKKIPLQGTPEEKIPQVIKDINALPKDSREAVSCVVYYPVDGDSKLMVREGKTFEICEKLKEIDEARDLQNIQEGLKPVIPTENQKIHFDIAFTDEDKDGKLDHIVSKYCLDGTMFNPESMFKRFHMLAWHEVDKEGKRKSENPSKIMIDFDQDEAYEEKGFDIEFNDKDHDGVFESYKFLKK